MPSGMRMPRSAVQTTLSSVRSRCTACNGRSAATDVELRPGRRLRHPSPARAWPDRGDAGEEFDDAVGEPRVPLQHAVEARVVEVRRGRGSRARRARPCGRRRSGERWAPPVSVPPERYSMSRMRAGPRSCRRRPSVACRRHPSSWWRCGGRGAAAAMRAAARSCASSSAAVNAGFVIFTTPTGSPSVAPRRGHGAARGSSGPAGCRAARARRRGPSAARTIAATSSGRQLRRRQLARAEEVESACCDALARCDMVPLSASTIAIRIAAPGWPPWRSRRGRLAEGLHAEAGPSTIGDMIPFGKSVPKCRSAEVREVPQCGGGNDVVERGRAGATGAWPQPGGGGARPPHGRRR